MTKNNEFEKWAKDYGFDVTPNKKTSNTYAEYETHCANLGWQAATTEANKRIAELESEVSNLHLNIKAQEQLGYELQASNHDLREVLENVLSWVVYQPVACHGMKCRESVCESCCGEEAAEIASKQAGEAVTIARKTLSAAPAESLQAFENEVIEKCAELANYMPFNADEMHEYRASDDCKAIAWDISHAIRALKEVK